MIIQFFVSRLWYCANKMQMQPLTTEQLIWNVASIGVVTALDVALSNVSLMYITLTLYTVMKSSVLVWTYIFSILLQLDTFRWDLFCCVVCICVGLALAVVSATDYSLLGIVIVLFASACGGMRWVLVQNLMMIDSESKHAVAAIYRFSPFSAGSMIVLAIAADVRPLLHTTYFEDISSIQYVELAVLVSMGGVIAFLLILTEVQLVRLTSSLTLGVLGQIKEMTQIVLAMLIFHDRLSLLNVGGIFIATIGVFAYKKIKFSSYQEETQQYASLRQVRCDA